MNKGFGVLTFSEAESENPKFFPLLARKEKSCIIREALGEFFWQSWLIGAYPGKRIFSTFTRLLFDRIPIASEFPWHIRDLQLIYLRAIMRTQFPPFLMIAL
jgi:hypothetical protein